MEMLWHECTWLYYWRSQADLIMSGTSYKDAVRGTEFDALDDDTAAEFEESIRRLTALRENRIEAYLEEKGWAHQRLFTFYRIATGYRDPNGKYPNGTIERRECIHRSDDSVGN